MSFGDIHVYWETLKVLLVPIFHSLMLVKILCILTQVRVHFSEEVFTVKSFC